MRRNLTCWTAIAITVTVGAAGLAGGNGWAAGRPGGEVPFELNGASPTPVPADSVSGWRGDLDYLYEQIGKLHPDPFFATDESNFVLLRDWIHEHIPDMSRGQIILSFMRLVALIGAQGHDGHSGLWPYMSEANFELYPLRLYWFEEGVYVVDADPQLDLVGAKVESINGRPVADLLEVVEPFVSRDGPYWVRSWAPIHILSPQFQQALGFGRSDGSAHFGLSVDGKRREVVLRAVPHADYHDRFPIVLWTGGLPNAEKPRYLHREDDYYWFEVWPDSRTLYFQYNAVTRENKAGQSLRDVLDGLRDVVRSGRVDRLLVDVRSNGGGDNTAYGELLEFLENDAFFDEPGRLYLAIGRMTFSAGVNFVTDTEQRTSAILVGEPTGGSPNQYGDATTFTMPYSGVRARISTLFWQKNAEDARQHHEPYVLAPVTASDYFAGQDRIREVLSELSRGVSQAD